MQDNGKVIALLIDAENVSPKYIKAIVDEVAVYGTPAYKRIYGDWTSNDMANWKRVLLEHNLTPIQQFSYTQGKNASDSAMIIDAMDILYANNVDGFCLVSSDSDFTKLASRLRESRMFVIGMGETKTPTAFKAACDTFKYLEVLLGTKTEAEAGGLPVAKADKKQPEKPEKAEKTEKAKKAVKTREKEPAKAGKRPEPQPESPPEPAPEPEEDELETAIVPLSPDRHHHRQPDRPRLRRGRLDAAQPGGGDAGADVRGFRQPQLRLFPPAQADRGHRPL